MILSKILCKKVVKLFLIKIEPTKKARQNYCNSRLGLLLANSWSILFNCDWFIIFIKPMEEVIDLQIIVSMLLDAIFGDAIGNQLQLLHPVEVIGKIIAFWEKQLYGYNENERHAEGWVFCGAVLLSVALPIFFIQKLAWLIYPPISLVIDIFLLYTALAYRSLKDEALPVAEALDSGRIDIARSRLSRIVGRDTWALSENGVVRAAVETIAESYVDGVVSVLFYMMLGYFFGFAALFAWIFKAVSTMDSMVGYEDDRYKNFGYASAKIDDVMNFIPARIGAVLTIAAVSFSNYDCNHALKVFKRDRNNHKSPNSAQSESVFAGLLGISLGGGAYYNGQYEERPVLGDNLREPVPSDIWRACDILDRSYALCALLVLIII